MTAVWFRLRAELGGRWPSWAALVLVIGLAGGVVLATAAGARRTDTAYPRFLTSSRAADVLISPAGFGRPGYYDAAAHLPGVRALGVVVFLNAIPVTNGGRRDYDTWVAAPGDAHYGMDLERPKLVAGRMFHPDRPDEAVVDQAAARHLHLRVGSPVTFYLFSGPQADVTRDQPSLRLSARVVGIIVTRSSVVSLSIVDSRPLILVTPAVFTAVGDKYVDLDGAYVRLRPSTSVTVFANRARALAERYPETGGQVFVGDEADPVAKVERALRPEAVTLALFSLLTAATALFVVGQMASRQLVLTSADYPTLRALGMSGTQLLALGLTKVGLVATCGAVLAVAAAAAASPLMPIGPARIAEPHPGISLDVAVLGAGFIGIVVLVLVIMTWPALRMASTPAGVRTAEVYATTRPPVVAGGASRLVAWPTAAVGLRMAMEPGRGRTAVPVRSTLAGTIIALAAIVAAYTFGANLSQLVDTPRLYGQTWDAAVELFFGTLPTAATSAQLRSQKGIAAWTFGNHGTLIAGGRQVPAIGLDRGSGPLLFPTLLDGRPPAASDEIVLGTRTLQRLHRRVGDVVNVQVNGRPAKLHIVGRAIFPAFSQGTFAVTDLGEGAAVAADVLAAPDPAAPNDIYNFVLIHVAPGVDPSATAAALAGFLCPANEASACALTAQRPTEIVNYTRVRNTPILLAGVLAAMAIATFVQLLATSTRRRRRDLAVLKTLGFVRTQVLATVAWQASALAAIAVVAGVPLGVLAGRWAWIAFAGQLGIHTEPNVPLAVLLAIPATLLLANAAALAPGLAAGRARPAAILRAE